MTPVKVNEGTFEPTGKAIICHCVALPDSVHDTEAVVPVIFDTATEVGLKHVIGGVQRIVASQPVLVPVALDVNEKDKQPVGDVDVKLGGKLAPVYVPTTGDVAKSPFLIIRLSPAAKLNVLKITVTTSPTLAGHAETNVLSLF